LCIPAPLRPEWLGIAAVIEQQHANGNEKKDRGSRQAIHGTSRLRMRTGREGQHFSAFPERGHQNRGSGAERRFIWGNLL